MKFPSKELLSEVLGVFEVIDIEEDYNELIIEYFETQDDVELNEDGVGGSTDKTINIYEFAFLTRNYLHKKYGYSLDMSLEIGEIFKNATQFYESML